MFVLHSQLVDQKSLEIFEALDQDRSETADYFQEKCSEISTDLLVQLRDKRLGNEALSLLRMGHPVEPIDSSVSKITPLMNAIQFNNIEISVILLEAGSSLFTQDINGENALHYVARSGSFRMLKNLIMAANNSSQQNKECASTFNVKRKFPEDLAKNARLAAIMKHLRVSGQYANVRLDRMALQHSHSNDASDARSNS